MKFPFTLPEFEYLQFTLDVSRFFGGPRLYCNGELLPKGTGRQYAFKDFDGNEHTLTLRNRGIDFIVPDVLYNGQVVPVAPPLPGVLAVLAWLPFMLIFVGGALGGFLGGLGAYFNLRLAHTQYPVGVRVGLMLGVALGAVVAWLILGVLISVLLLPGHVPQPDSP